MVQSFVYQINKERREIMLERIQDWWKELEPNKKTIVLGIILAIICVLIVCVVVFGIMGDKTPTSNSETETQTESMNETETMDNSTELFVDTETELETELSTEVVAEPEEDPQNISGGMTDQSGASVDISEVVDGTNETQQITLGIDVAKYQGTIDWKQVADSGVDFAMVRVGYRTLKTGEIIADSNAKYNMQEASKYGIKVGVYFFSTAITEEEAVAEANWVADYISKYQITYPVVYNCEGYEDAENRQYSLTKTQRTDIALAFLKQVSQRGYTPMFYASKSEMQGDAKWETSRISPTYKIWVAQYPSVPYPQTASSSYSGTHAMWQYTNQGTVPGINKPVDMNVAYFGYTEVEGPQDTESPEDVEADVEVLMNFRAVNEQVTAKEKTNLRDIPSQGSDATVMYTLTNGEVATRTGISDSGWSRLEFNGQTYYAVSSYLTTDLTVKQPEQSETTEESNNTVQTQFVDVDELVTAKEAVNLRTLPSVTNENSQVVVQIVNGEVVRRTGINNELGWSRVEYNGQVLYCVSSYLTPAQQ